MNVSIFKVGIYLLAFCLACYGLSSIRFDKILFKDRPRRARLLFFILAMALAYLIANFILGLFIFMI